jgi:ABC-2 type transport system permease protein
MLFKLSLFFVFISLIAGQGRLDPDTLAPALVGFIIWFYAAIALNSMSRSLTEEAQSGTLEQMFMSPAPTAVLILARSASAVILATLMLLLIVSGLVLGLGIYIPLAWIAIPIFLLTMTGLTGLGFMMAGATLIFKQTDQLTNLVENFLLYLGGTILAVDLLPHMLGRFASILPTTHGVALLRNVTLEGASLGQIWDDGSLTRLAVNALAYIVAGWAVFSLCERIAETRGSLGQY